MSAHPAPENWPYAVRTRPGQAPPPPPPVNTYVHPGYGQLPTPVINAPPLNNTYGPSPPPFPPRPLTSPSGYGHPGRLVPPLPPQGLPLPPTSPQSQHFVPPPLPPRTPSPGVGVPPRRLPPPAPLVLNQGPPLPNLATRPSVSRPTPPVPSHSPSTSFHQAATNLQPIQSQHPPSESYNQYPVSSSAGGVSPQYHNSPLLSPGKQQQAPPTPNTPSVHEAHAPNAPQNHMQSAHPSVTTTEPTSAVISRPGEKDHRQTFVVHNPDVGSSSHASPPPAALAFPAPHPAPSPHTLPSPPAVPTIATLTTQIDDLAMDDPPPAYSLEAPHAHTALPP